LFLRRSNAILPKVTYYTFTEILSSIKTIVHILLLCHKLQPYTKRQWSFILVQFKLCDMAHHLWCTWDFTLHYMHKNSHYSSQITWIYTWKVIIHCLTLSLTKEALQQSYDLHLICLSFVIYMWETLTYRSRQDSFLESIPYLGGRQFSNCGINSGGKLVGKFTRNWMMRRPFSKGFLYWGIPSFITHFTSPCLVTSPATNYEFVLELPSPTWTAR
jgi:hypothetical protein